MRASSAWHARSACAASIAFVVEEIERRAEDVLARVPAWIWDGESLPVPVEDLADSVYGLLVREVEDMSAAPGAPALGPGQTLSGLLLPAAGEIWVNAAEAREWPGRWRFTVGHELGHWILHSEARNEAVFCRTPAVDPEKEGEPRQERPLPESEADAFAAALLMPAALLRAEYERDRDFARLCAAFGSSRAAMGKRLHAVIPRRER